LTASPTARSRRATTSRNASGGAREGTGDLYPVRGACLLSFVVFSSLLGVVGNVGVGRLAIPAYCTPPCLRFLFKPERGILSAHSVMLPLFSCARAVVGHCGVSTRLLPASPSWESVAISTFISFLGWMSLLGTDRSCRIPAGIVVCAPVPLFAAGLVSCSLRSFLACCHSVLRDADIQSERVRRHVERAAEPLTRARFCAARRMYITSTRQLNEYNQSTA